MSISLSYYKNEYQLFSNNNDYFAYFVAYITYNQTTGNFYDAIKLGYLWSQYSIGTAVYVYQGTSILKTQFEYTYFTLYY